MIQDNKTTVKHWYLLALHIGYIIKDKTDTDKVIGSSIITTNVVVTPPTKKITESVIENARQLGLLKMRDIFNVDPKNTTDITILNIAYLGMMTEAQYFDINRNPIKAGQHALK